MSKIKARILLKELEKYIFRNDIENGNKTLELLEQELDFENEKQAIEWQNITACGTWEQFYEATLKVIEKMGDKKYE